MPGPVIDGMRPYQKKRSSPYRRGTLSCRAIEALPRSSVRSKVKVESYGTKLHGPPPGGGDFAKAAVPDASSIRLVLLGCSWGLRCGNPRVTLEKHFRCRQWALRVVTGHRTLDLSKVWNACFGGPSAVPPRTILLNQQIPSGIREPLGNQAV